MIESIYQIMRSNNVTIEHHCSDLYVPVNDTTTAILDDSKWNATTFRSNLDGALWYDIPFGFDPFWMSRCRTTKGKIILDTESSM